MRRKHQLRRLRKDTVINVSSKKQETRLGQAMKTVERALQDEFEVEFHHRGQWRLIDIVESLRKHFPDVEFTCHFETTYMQPDGGILSIVDDEGELYPILIVEVKNQGTNDLRREEGKEPQARGNAIERLGKNVIGFRTAMAHEGILPFLCFGDGCDFVDESTILDRVSTIAMFGELNEVRATNEGPHGRFNRGSFFFRAEPWTEEEMAEVMLEVARRSIHYYFAAYGEDRFAVEYIDEE